MGDTIIYNKEKNLTTDEIGRTLLMNFLLN